LAAGGPDGKTDPSTQAERNRTMKRNLIAVAAVALGLGTNAVLADNGWAFDDAYWKQAQGTQLVQSTRSIETQGKYDFVNQYNY
jgi:hypothetical protein